MSRVLNNPSAVKETKRKLVNEAIAALNYRPNQVARGLKSKTFGTIALIVSDISNAFFAEMVTHIERPLAAEGFDLLLCNTDMNKERLAHYLRHIPSRGVDAVIISGSSHLTTPEITSLLNEVVARGIPVICSGARVPELAIPTVVSDSTRALHDLAKHLATTDRKKVAYLGGKEHSSMAHERLEDFRHGLNAFGIQLRPELTLEIPYDFAAGREATAAVLREHPSIDAVVCGGDQMALGALRGARDVGRSAPSDISITGFDDIAVAAYADPPLTTISVGIEETAQELASHALGSIAGFADPYETRIACRLVIRGSSTPPS